MACVILVSPSGVEPVPLTGAYSFNHWTTREVPYRCDFLIKKINALNELMRFKVS